jgi:hypothetical protein
MSFICPTNSECGQMQIYTGVGKYNVKWREPMLHGLFPDNKIQNVTDGSNPRDRSRFPNNRTRLFNYCNMYHGRIIPEGKKISKDGKENPRPATAFHESIEHGRFSGTGNIDKYFKNSCTLSMPIISEFKKTINKYSKTKGDPTYRDNEYIFDELKLHEGNLGKYKDSFLNKNINSDTGAFSYKVKKKKDEFNWEFCGKECPTT